MSYVLLVRSDSWPRRHRRRRRADGGGPRVCAPGPMCICVFWFAPSCTRRHQRDPGRGLWRRRRCRAHRSVGCARVVRRMRAVLGRLEVCSREGCFLSGSRLGIAETVRWARGARAIEPAATGRRGCYIASAISSGNRRAVGDFIAPARRPLRCRPLVDAEAHCLACV